MTKKSLVAIEAEPIQSVTAQQMQQTLEVARRTLKQELKDRNDALRVELTEIKRKISKLLDPVYKSVEKRVRARASSGCYGITALTDAYNHFVSCGTGGRKSEEISTEQLFDDVVLARSHYSSGGGHGIPSKLSEMMIDGEFKATLYLCLGVPDGDPDNGDWDEVSDSDMCQVTRNITVELEKHEHEELGHYDILQRDFEDKSKQVQANENKLGNLEKVIEQMETKLMTEQLRSDSQGSKFLDTVTAYLKDFLETGSQIKLLEESK